MKCIEGVEKFLLGTFLTNDELDIIDQKYIVVAVFFAEFRGGNVVFITDRIDQLIGKLLGSNVKDLGFRVVF